MKKLQWVSGIFLVITCVSVVFFIFSSRSIEAAVRPSVSIDNNASRTEDRDVTLYLTGPENVSEMRISNNGTPALDASWEPFRSRRSWKLDYGRGTKRVFVQFKTSDGRIDRTVYQDSIFYSIPEEMGVDMEINDGEEETDRRSVQITFEYTAGVEELRLSNTPDMNGVPWQRATRGVTWVLSPESGVKTVYVQFKDGNEQTTQVSDSITYVAPARIIEDRSLIRGQNGTVYYHGVDGLLHPFHSTAVFLTWYDRVAPITEISDTKLREFVIGNSMCVRGGTWLVQFPPVPRVYAVEPGCILKPLYSPIEAYLLYGPRWADRIISLPLFAERHYRVIDPRHEQVEDTEVDRDQDGVPEETEAVYGSSDRTEDTDGDWLSDYEEIYIWFTDPDNADTDGDGYADGREILAGFSPLGKNRLQSVPRTSYQYPAGSMVRNPDNDRIYYVDVAGNYRELGRNTTDRRITSNNLQPQFLITPAYDIVLEPIIRTGVSREDELLMYPTKRVGTALQPL
jgi:hypothetical protein